MHQFLIKREAFDEWRLGQVSVQFFEPKIWRWAYPKLQWTTEEIPNDIFWAPGMSPFIQVQRGWILALPTMAITRYLESPN